MEMKPRRKQRRKWKKSKILKYVPTEKKRRKVEKWRWVESRKKKINNLNTVNTVLAGNRSQNWSTYRVSILCETDWSSPISVKTRHGLNELRNCTGTWDQMFEMTYVISAFKHTRTQALGSCTEFLMTIGKPCPYGHCWWICYLSAFDILIRETNIQFFEFPYLISESWFSARRLIRRTIKGVQHWPRKWYQPEWWRVNWVHCR